jgi:large subunit ribosomal protein L10
MVAKKYKDKAAEVADLKDKMNRASAVVVTEYRGLKAGDLVKLRGNLREANVELRVVKNSLIRRATEGTPLADALGNLAGPTAVAMGFGEPADAAKVLSKSAGEFEKFAVLRGLIETMVCNSSQIETIGKLPSKPELQAKAVGTLQGPLAGLVFTLQGVLTQFAGTLQSKVEKESGAAA